MVDFYWFAGFSLGPSLHISLRVINVLFEQAAAVTSPSRDDYSSLIIVVNSPE